MYKITYESHIVKVSIQLKHFWPFYRQIWTINARKQCQKNKVCLHAGTSPIKTMRFFKAAGDSRHVSWTIIYKWHKWLKRERLIFWMTKELPIHPGSCTYIILSPEVALRKWMRFMHHNELRHSRNKVPYFIYPTFVKSEIIQRTPYGWSKDCIKMISHVPFFSIYTLPYVLLIANSIIIMRENTNQINSFKTL